MGKRDRERKARIQAGVETPITTPKDPMEKARHGICPFPGCTGSIMRGEGGHGFCAAHEKFLNELLFILPYIRWEHTPDKDKLVLPGHPDFPGG